MMPNGDWVGRAAIGAGVAFVVIGASAAAFMGGSESHAVEVREHVRVEAPEAPHAPAMVAVEGFSLRDLPGRIEAAIAEGIEAELAAAVETGDFDITIDGESVTAAEWRDLDAAEREERLARLRAKVAELKAESAEARAEGSDARAAILDRVAGSIGQLVERLESFE